MTISKYMFSQHRLILNHLKNHAPTYYGIMGCLFLLLACFITLLFTNNYTSIQKLTIENRYGTQISQVTATKLKRATANNDLISMQAELNELTKSEHITTAIIYGVSNRVKVQSGIPADQLNKGKRYLTFSAPITQDEAIIGQLSIIIPELNNKTYINIISSVIFFITLVILLTLLVKATINIQKITTYEEQQRGNEIRSKPKIINNTTIKLLLQFKNPEKIFNQLSKEIREKKQDEINLSINKSLKIYNGKIEAIDTHSAFITLNDNNEQQAILNAICCAGLLLKTANEQRWLIKTNIVIYKADLNINDIKKLSVLQHLRNHDKESIFIDKHSAVIANSRISTQAPNNKFGDFVEIQNLCEQYQTLLNNQLKHLQSNI